MGSRELFYYYKETRVSLEPASPATVVHATVPPANGGRRGLTGRMTGNGHDGTLALVAGASSKTNRSGGGVGDNYSKEERVYRAKSLATDANVYHRRHHHTPRSFLWRVLEGGHVLSIRAMDVARRSGSGSASDAPLTLNLHFAKPIRSGCVALADPAQHDALAVFVLDEALYLHHLQLRPDVFRKRAAAGSEAGLDFGEASKPYLSSTFNFKQPRRLVAVSASELVLSLHDGGIIRFRREQTHESHSWKESFHSPVGLMQGLRSILPFQGGPTIKHEGTNLEITAAASAVVTSMSLGDDDSDKNTFFFSVCLDHRLRVWNVERGEVCYTGDILGLPRETHEVGRWTVDPGQNNLVRILELGESSDGSGVCICVTYSPVGAGAFKFWKATATADGKVALEPFEAAPEALVPPTPTSSDVWTMADFAVTRPEPHKLSLWVLWKNNLVYRVMQLECAPTRVEAAWAHEWLGVHVDSSSLPPPAQTSGPCDPTDAAEKWLDLIFYPGRFSRATLETALATYERRLRSIKTTNTTKNKGSTGGNGGNLQEAICAALGSAATLERASSGSSRDHENGMDYDLFRSASEIQWRRFYRLLVELDKQRGEALALALDPEQGLAWVVCADWVAAVRESSELERLLHNAPGRLVPGRGADATLTSSATDSRLEKVSRLLTAAWGFVESFSDGMVQQTEAALRAELFHDAYASKSDEERLQLFLDKAGFWRHLAEDECAQVVDILGGDSFADVQASSYETLFALLETATTSTTAAASGLAKGGRGSSGGGGGRGGGDYDARAPLTQFGLRLAIRGVQDAAELLYHVIFRQLVLLVHMELEVEDDKLALHARLDVGHAYGRLVDQLRRLELLRWLAKTEFTVALSRSARESLSGSFSQSFSAGGSFSPSVSQSFSGSVGSVGAGGSASASGGSPSAGRRGPAAEDGLLYTVVTVLEGSVGHLLGVHLPSSSSSGGSSGGSGGLLPLSAQLTDMVVDVCAAESSIELDPAMIQCMLLKRERPDLALQLSVFASDDAFSTYIQGRTFLALRDWDTASTYFRKAAVGLSAKLRHAGRHSAGLLDDTEWNLLYSGLPSYYAHIVSLYDRQKAHSFVMDFARLSLQFSAPPSSSGALSDTALAVSNGRTEMLSRLFSAAAALSRFDVAHTALQSMGREPAPTAAALQHACLRFLVEKMAETGQVADLLGLPFGPSGPVGGGPGGGESAGYLSDVSNPLGKKAGLSTSLRDAVDAVLEHKCRAAMEVLRGTQWHHILYAWRLAHNDYRGAASVLLDRLQKLQQAGEGNRFLAAPSSVAVGAAGDDVLDTPVTQAYLMLINTLSCVEPKQAWIYTEDVSLRPKDDENKNTGHGGTRPKTAPAAAAAAAAVSGSDAMASLLQKAAAVQREPWRKVVTLADIRKQYQDELDRIAAIQNNQFGFGEDDEDEDVSMGGL